MSSYGHNSKLLMTYFKSCSFKVKRSLYIPKCMDANMSACLAQWFCTGAINHKVSSWA